MEVPQDSQVVQVDDQGQKQKPASAGQNADRSLNILKVKCQVSTCNTMVFRTSTTKLLVAGGLGGRWVQCRIPFTEMPAFQLQRASTQHVL